MDFQQERMKQMIEHDRFLHASYMEAIETCGDESAALKLLFDTYVQNEPMMRNAYEHLTNH
ncbi:hypothetical protein [Alteribacillus bidgolensis]|uniref:Uncharacterized protein n=1 Tax=Alteribacillus bidgolensis TaxID=930129 RepID=A0A1G8MIT9_9BACI|nr:hypothetical protein [Alteribacillus bidgolensis]SDI67869.1 hypothetical protein SAMN05216352_11060 [Alteribacillus bidgolensis]